MEHAQYVRSLLQKREKYSTVLILLGPSQAGYAHLVTKSRRHSHK